MEVVIDACEGSDPASTALNLRTSCAKRQQSLGTGIRGRKAGR